MPCTQTFAGLCIYSPTLGPGEISERMGFRGTDGFERDASSRFRPNREHNFWLWSTQSLVDSTDHLDHLSAIFSQLAGKESVLDQLRSDGCTITISCYWDSDGDGGPYLTVEAIQRLAQLGVDIWWDIYFDRGAESNDP
jgi:Domain of unknown function (DUF4279)